MCIMRLRRVGQKSVKSVLYFGCLYLLWCKELFSRPIRVNKHCTYILPVVSYDSVYIRTFECCWLDARLFYTRVRKICKSLASNL